MKDVRLATARITLSADDYGLSPGVGIAIRSLAAQRRITAASCMTVTPHWASEAKLIPDVSEHFEFGLHITLTEHSPLTNIPDLCTEGRLPGVGSLFRSAVKGTLPLGGIEAEIEAQIEAFEREAGFPPRFFDGHHHVHQFPGIRDCLIAVLKRHPSSRGAFVRTCEEPLSRIFRRRESLLKSFVVGALGRSLKPKLRQSGFRTNRGFAGFYRQDTGRSIGEVFRKLLLGLNEGAMVMCHPGVVDAALVAADSLTTPREVEFAFLGGDEFPRLLEAEALSLVPPSALNNGE